MADVEKVVGTSGDYSTWASFLAAIPSDITSATGTDEHWIGKGKDQEFLEDFAISGITTDSVNRVTLTYDTGAKTSGVSRDAGGSGCTIKGSSGTGTIRSGVQYLTVEGIDVAVSTNGVCIGLQNISYSSGNNETLIKDCIIRGTTASSSGYLLAASKSNLNAILRNCVGYSGRRFTDTRSSDAVEISYCTVFMQADSLGFVSSDELTCKNTYVGRSSGSSQDFWTGGSSPSGNNNASSDSTATTDYTSSFINVDPADQFTSLTTGSEDFTLKSGNTLQDNGATIAGITEDIINTLRNVSTPTIGAFEYDTGPPPSTTVPVFMKYYRNMRT